jgi:hypothetical protein
MASLLSTPRLTPYLTLTNGNLKEALQLYRWNIELSGALYEAVHVVEVIIRNAVDEQLRIWNGNQRDRATGRSHGSDWLLDPARVLQRLVGRDIRKALGRATRELSAKPGRKVTHDDVLAQLSFGTWRFLLPDRDPGRQHLWNHAISRAFPHHHGHVQTLIDDIHAIYALRNRLAHLEPVLATNTALVAHVRRIREVLDTVDPRAATWFVSRQRVNAVLANRP